MHAFNIKLAKIVTVKKRNLEIISDFPQCNNVNKYSINSHMGNIYIHNKCISVHVSRKNTYWIFLGNINVSFLVKQYDLVLSEYVQPF